MGITKYAALVFIRPLSLTFAPSSFDNNKVALGDHGLEYTYTLWFFGDIYYQIIEEEFEFLCFHTIRL